MKLNDFISLVYHLSKKVSFNHHLIPKRVRFEDEFSFIFREFSVVAPSKRINQFPFENVLTIKDLLCVVCRRMGPSLEARPENGLDSESRLETYPMWLPTTFNLKTELPKFVSYFQQRENM